MTTATGTARRESIASQRTSPEMLLLEIHLPVRGRIDGASLGLLLGLLAGSAGFWTAVGWVVVLLAR